MGGLKAGVATAMNAAMRSEMTAATPAAGRRMLAEAYLRSGKPELASGALACGLWGCFSHR
ncbi:MAG: hypothetical protein IPN76_27955 [Saprospiraceae bacterium]|nr:hypothetical protein [Saprospiraceae bacterium]